MALLAIAVGPSLGQSAGISFGKSLLFNESSTRPTSLQFGPDGRLYAAQQNGSIKAYNVNRLGANNYTVTSTETINLVKQIPNHNDDGSLNTNEINRQITGIVVTGTAANPIIYASSSDPRIGGKEAGTDTNLDTNSGIVSKLTWNGSAWDKVDLVRGLPRSEENHSVNGMQLSADETKLYLAIGGNTNKGAPSNNFALLPEVALTTAILKIDLQAIGNNTYDLPTLDDEDRAGNPDANDPFGGNDGKNQAKLLPGGPVQVYASGFRNPYDLVMTSNGKMYTIDNGGNAGWGDVPVGEGPGGTCTNQVNEPGTTDDDSLHYVSGPGYYGGHPNPTRGNMANTFNASNPQSPVSSANPVECDYRANGPEKGELATFPASTNGIDEYTASNFGGAMQGDLLAASFDNKIYRIKLNAAGDGVVSKEALFSSVGQTPLDVTTRGDADPFPGTIWVADIQGGNIVVFEPADGGGSSCTAADDPALDEDEDGFDNADEIDNGTNPCSAADVPPDADGDNTSDLNDPDDDNDTMPDTSDPFAVDAQNGKTTSLPVNYTWDNDAPNPGGLLNLGFTGLMSNHSSDYKNLYDPANMTAGGAAGAVTIDEVPSGDAFKATNTQMYGFQFGVNVGPSTGAFTAHTRILAPFAGMTPQDYQAMGLFIGNGDQDNYVRLSTLANGGAGGIQFAKEVGDTYNKRPNAAVTMPGPDYVDLYLTVDPAANTVKPFYAVTTNGNTGPRTALGTTTSIPAGWLNDNTGGLAVGIISTSAGPGPEFPATWDFIKVVPDGQGAGDTTAPVAKAPTQSLIAGSTVVGASAVPTKIQWSATDSGSGVASYEVQQSTNGGAWTDVALSSATAKSVTLNLGVGNTYGFRARATDKAGNTSGWEQGPSFKVNLFQESNSAIGYAGTWSTQNLTSASGKSLMYASAADALASLTFSNNALNASWVALKAADRGKAEVWVDGALANTVDLYAATLQSRKSVFVANGLDPAASHTLEVRVLGTNNVSSSGTRVDVDGFVVLEKVPS